MEKKKKKKSTEGRSKIEIVRVASTDRDNFLPLDGVRLRTSCNQIRVGTYCPEPEVKMVVCSSKPPIEQSRKFKKNLGPVSRLLRRRHHATCLATKSCDNIYSVNRSSSSLDWRLSQAVNVQGLQSGQSNSLDWRVGRSVNSNSNKMYWRDATRSAEQLSKSGTLSSDHLQTSSTKSKLVSLLRRLSPRLSRPGNKGSLQSSPTICPWVRVEYSSESINDENKHEESQENDASFQQELQLNELRKRMAGIPISPQVIGKVSKDGKEPQSSAQPKLQVQMSENSYNHLIHKAVHEDRVDEDRRRASGQARAGGEVAGLEDAGDSCAATLTPSVPGAGGIRSNRRTRPLSLAVQPLNYRRLDPDPKIANSIVTRHHSNMTSQESIGSCSLDVDQSASDRSENTIDSVSKKTLHSLNLSCNGDTVPSPENLTNGSSETLQRSHLTPNEKLKISNGHRKSPELEQLTVKKPSYLGLACSISGYSGLTRYDSKLREGFRSRDSSPGTRLITRETSPAGFRSNESLNVPAHHYTPKSQSISPLAMDRQNGFSNGLKEECKVEAYRESRNAISICQGFSEVDKGVLQNSLQASFGEISPIRPTAPTKCSSGMSPMSCSQQNKSYSSRLSGSSPNHHGNNLANTSILDSSVLNGSAEVGNQELESSSISEKSFIEQRVERLYGRRALAQGFFKRGTTKSNVSGNSLNKSSNNNNVSTDNANAEESLKKLPVLRHLRPEFRAQLPVVSPRKPTDGSEQIIKPLRRVTPPRQVEKKPKIPISSNLEGNTTKSGPQQKLNTNVTSIPDQQLAAPKVVLPVLEPSASSTIVAKQAQEAEKTVEEKDGHYFIKLLKEETDKLLLLAASVEVDLDSNDSDTLPEEAAGKLRSAAGKARLLASQKMQQFEGLCQKNINQLPGEEFPTTNEDLAGFWDMVMLQVVQVNELFDQIEKLRDSQWQEIVDKKPIASAAQNGSTKRRVVAIHKPKSTANSEANKKAREAREQARRQLIEERRRAMRSNAQNSENTVKIFAPDS